MNLHYSGSGKVFYNQKEYKCDLYTNEDQGGILIKINVFESIADFLELPITIDLLRGELDSGFKFSLLNCSRGETKNLISEGKSVFDYYAKYFIKGVGGSDCNNIKFNKMSFQVSDVIMWGEVSGYTVGEKLEIRENNDRERMIFENEDFSIKYRVICDFLPGHFSDLLKEKIVLKQSGNIEISSCQEDSIDFFEDTFKKVKRLIELSALENLHLIRLTGWSSEFYETYNEEKHERAVEVISGDFERNENEKDIRKNMWKWITLPELVANDCFSHYFQKYKTLEPIFDLFSEILKATEMPIVRVFLNIVQALETYHSRFITNDIKQFKERIMSVIIKDRTDDSVHDDIEYLMANSKKFITLESRLADLLLAEYKIIFETGDLTYTDFPNVIALTRNYYIHYDERIKQDGKVLSEEELPIYCGILFYILEYYILRELGFTDINFIRKKLNIRWGNPSHFLSLTKKSKEIEKKNANLSALSTPLDIQ